MNQAEDEVFRRILDRLRTGEKSAWNDLALAVTPMLEPVLRKIRQGMPGVARWEETGDALNETLLKVWKESKNWEVIPTAEEFKRWVVRSARSVLIDRFRHYYGPEGVGLNLKSAPAADSSSRPPLDMSDPGPSPIQLAEWTEVHAAINALPHHLWDVVDRYYYQNLTWEKVVEDLGALDRGISVRTAKRRYREAQLLLEQKFRGKLSAL